MNPPLLSAYLQTALVFAARYTHTRDTGGTLSIVMALEEHWTQLNLHTQRQVLEESKNATTNIRDWQRLQAFATKHEN